MELKISELSLPQQITFNYEELKQELTEKVQIYKTLVYTDEQIKDAKSDKANLNKLKKALNDERIRLEKEYMVPFNDFKGKVNEIIKIIDEPIGIIDTQVKGYEDKQKEEKLSKIKELWEEMEVPDGLKFEMVYEEKMLNTSYYMNHVKQKMLDDIKKFNREMETLENLPEFGFEAKQVYIRTFDINRALAEGQRMSQIAKAKAEAEERARIEAEEKARLEAEAKAKEVEANPLEGNMNPPIVEKPKTWVNFSAYLTVDEALMLKKFFDDNKIDFKAI